MGTYHETAHSPPSESARRWRLLAPRWRRSSTLRGGAIVVLSLSLYVLTFAAAFLRQLAAAPAGAGGQPDHHRHAVRHRPRRLPQ